MTTPAMPGGSPWRLPGDPPPPLRTFLDQGLPTLLRRLYLWKGLHRHRHRDLIEDLHQELWLDYLAHEQEILALPVRARHARWFRLVSRNHYRWRERAQRHAGEAALGQLVHEPAPTLDGWLSDLAQTDRLLLARIRDHACYLKNGRLNTQETARSMHVSPQTVRRLWGNVAEAAGLDHGFLRFWCRRLAEALLSLGIDLLRHPEANPRNRLRRIRRIRTQLFQRPLPMHLKQLLGRYRIPAQTRRELSPVGVLVDALHLHPDHANTHLWLVEAALSARDLQLAARTLRGARRAGADQVQVLLLRARLLETRGRPRQAEALLQDKLYDASPGTLLKRVS